jgi:hypothetical protein
MGSTQSEDGIFRFSTDALPERDRVAVYREELGQRVVRLDLEPDRGQPFHAKFELRAFPGLKIAVAELSALVVRRTRRLIADDTDALGLVLTLARTHSLSQIGREHVSGPGDALLVSGAEPFVSIRPVSGRVVVLRVPHDTLASPVPDVADRIMRPIPRDADALRLLRSYLAVLDDGHAMKTPELRRAVATHIHDLIALAVGGTYDRTSTGRESVRAARLLFEETGQSFARFVDEERMKRAFELLTNPARSGTRIADIAAEVGYAEHSSFDRAFRRSFGHTPSDVRRNRPSDTPTE